MQRTFSLEAVLRLRQHKEEAEERALAALNTRRQQTEATLDRVHQELQVWTDERVRAVGKAMSGEEQHAIYARRNLLQDAQTRLHQQLEMLEVQRQKQQAVYQAANSARECLSELKQRQRAGYEAEAQRREQARAEDLFLGRWSR